MSTPKITTPAEIARETLKLLMTRRMAPSPDNYRTIYNEIAGIREKDADAFPEKELRTLIAALPKELPLQQRLTRELDQALKGQNWDSYKRTLVDFIKEHSTDSDLAWGELIAELIRQWDTKHTSLTPARKREALEHILSSASKKSEILFERLQRLVKSWAQNRADLADVALTDSTDLQENSAFTDTSITASNVAPPPLSRSSELLAELRDIFVFAVETAVLGQLADEPALATEARNLIVSVHSANTIGAMQELLAATKRFAYRLEFVVEDREELRSGLLKLLQLLIDNVSELVVDDRWLNGQITMVRDIVGRPMNIRTVHEAEHRIKEVIFKQSQLKHSLTEAKEALKHMLAGFVDHLADFADSTSDYHDKIERYVEKISKADDIRQLEDVLSDVINATRTIQLNAQRSRDDLRTTQKRVEDAEKRVNELQLELDKASTLVRHDQLTGTLNRRGLEEAFDHEFARSRRRNSPLCVGLLDIDNFKKLNDSLGHEAGDAALIHLATTVRETLRPQDTVARYGGEEFIILLPDTPLPDAQTALIRLQRELTKRLFLHENEKVLITFSAGVADLRPDDTQATIIKRADEAMYTAKKTGKNRVLIG